MTEIKFLQIGFRCSKRQFLEIAMVSNDATHQQRRTRRTKTNEKRKSRLMSPVHAAMESGYPIFSVRECFDLKSG